MDDDDSKWIEGCIAAVLEEGRYDWIMAAELATIVMEVTGIRNPAVVRRLALQVIDIMLNKELAQLGDVIPGRGFVPWSGDSVARLDRARREWSTDRAPHIGEGGWLCVRPCTQGEMPLTGRPF